MKNSKTFTVQYRRKRENKTNYRRRLKLLLSGRFRLVIRKSLKNIYAQIVEYKPDGDNIIAAASMKELEKLGWKFNSPNTSSAYLVGLLIAKKAKDKGIKDAVLDTGLNSSVAGARIYAVLKGAVDNGLIIPHSDNVLPSENRINGKHIEDYAARLNKEQFEKKFSIYLKNGLDPRKISSSFEEAKRKIIGV